MMKMGGNNATGRSFRGKRRLAWLQFCDVIALEIQPLKGCSILNGAQRSAVIDVIRTSSEIYVEKR